MPAQANWAGPVNVVAPELVTMGELARVLGRTLRRPARLPLPVAALRLVLGEFADSLSPGQKVVPTVAESMGYEFKNPTLAEALGKSFGRKKA